MKYVVYYRYIDFFTMLKNKNFLFILFLLTFSAGTLLFVAGADAATGLQYTLLEKIPGFSSTDGSDLPKYLKALYRFGLIAIVLSAVFMLSIGGFFYLTSAGNTSALSTAKSIIFDSLIGLVIALAAYLILNVINPDLVNVSINGLSAVSTPRTAPTAPSVTPTPGASWPDDSSVRSNLPGISFNRANCTTEGQTAACTSVSNLGSAAISGLNTLKSSCNCSITVTGGTEYWLHSERTTHRPENSVVDLGRSADLLAHLQSSGTRVCDVKGRPVYRLNGADYWDEDNAHFHVNYGQPICK